MNNRVLETLIGLTIFCLPLYVLRCRDFAFCISPIPVTFLEVLVVLTLVLWLIVKLNSGNLLGNFRDLLNSVPVFLQICLGLFLISALFSAIFVSSTSAAWGIYKAYFAESFLFALVVFDYLKTTKNYKLIVWTLFGAGLWVGGLTIFNQLLQSNPGNPAEFVDRGRASAVYSTSNAVGLFLGPIFVLLFGYYLGLQRAKNSIKFEKNSAIICLIIISFGLVSSGSRGAYLGIFAAITFFFSYLIYFNQADSLKKNVNKLFYTVILIFCSLIFVFFLNINNFAKNPPKLPDNLQVGFQSRLCLWEGAVNMLKEQPVTGVGLSNFQQAHANLRTCSQENSIYPHNIFLNFWTEVGIFGLISFLGICVYLFFKLLRQTKLDYLALGLAAVFVEILFHGLLDVPYFKNDLSVLFWLILALSLWKLTILLPPENSKRQ